MAPARVTVRRTGGFMGRTLEGTLDLTGSGDLADAADAVAEVRALLDRVDLAAAPTGRPFPDMYTYTFEVDGVRAGPVPEHLLSDDLRRLATLVLPDLTR